MVSQSQILYESSIGRGNGVNVYIRNLGHMTKTAAMPIYDKTLQKSSSQEAMADGNGT